MEIDKTIIKGRNAVLEALNTGRLIDKIIIKEGEIHGSIKEIFAKAKELKIRVDYVPKKKLDNFGENNQGIIAFAPVVSYSTVFDILNVAKEKSENPFIIILNNITDPHNFGAIIRTAVASGVHGIIIPSRRSVGLTSIVEKTSAGAINYIKIAKVSNIASTIEQLKKQNIWIVGADMKGANYFDIDFKIPVAICIGSEGEGISPLVLKKCDFRAKIPMIGNINSLNASVASAILMYEVVKQRIF
ncbi:MAG: 23S rRNA (guanosine(2251)-2'-O)-methyltransferase RlmB [Defluviitaleaceae bacterium]|nr:23S rRNA (guanosine(2251)-2'-O)-methyltransferase RlmB [Defluviitaleaceae bacterium]